MWVTLSGKNDIFAGNRSWADPIIARQEDKIYNNPIYLTDKDPFENVREVQKLYECANCGKCAFEDDCRDCAEDYGAYVNDMEEATRKDIQNFDEGVE